MTQNLHVCTICCRPEVVYDVISSRSTVSVFHVVNFEAASSNSFRDMKKNHFVTAETVDIDDSIKQKRFRVSLNNFHYLTFYLLFLSLPAATIVYILAKATAVT